MSASAPLTLRSLTRSPTPHAPVPPHPPTERLPPLCSRFVVGVVSDTHLGSKHCRKKELARFIRYAYRRGARHLLHAGDVLDGASKHGRFELTHTGLEAQALELFATLPRLDGLSYHAIDGNHDDTFSDAVGLDAGAYVEQLFRARGRTDFHHHGRRSAFLRLGGAVVHLWHPQGSCGASVEPRVRQKIESYAPGERPDVLLVGHWHRYVHTTARGVEGIACPTFQAGQSAFGKSFVSDPALGGLLLSWTRDRRGQMASFRVERRRCVDPKRLDELDAFGRRAS